jgi:uncharacterized protein YndB with AHSA1/START domain
MTDKKSIELSKTFAAPASVIFDAISNGQLLKSTGVKPETFKHDFSVDGEYYLEWTSHDTGDCSGRYLQIEPNQSVKFTWHSRFHKAATNRDTVVTVTLTEDGKTTQMKLVHEGLDPGFCYEDHLAGWTSSVDEFDAELRKVSTLA